MKTYPYRLPWGEVGDRLFHVIIVDRHLREIKQNWEQYLAYFHQRVNCQMPNSRQFPKEQKTLSHHEGLHGRSVHVFGLIHHSVNDPCLLKTSALQVTTGEVDYEN